MPLRFLRPVALGTVTWIGPALGFSSSQSSAALRWLSTAPGPHASTAAIHRASSLSARCPTA